MMNKYLVFKRSSASVNRVNRWRVHCQRAEIPFVTVQTRTALADVKWTAVSLLEYEGALRARRETIHSKLFELFEKYGGARSRYKGGFLKVKYLDIPMCNAQALATALFDFFRELTVQIDYDHPRYAHMAATSRGTREPHVFPNTSDSEANQRHPTNYVDWAHSVL